MKLGNDQLKLKLYGFPIRRSLVLEDMALTFGLYAVFAAYAAGYLPVTVFLVVAALYAPRAFNLRHEKAHSPKHSGFASAWFDGLADYLYVHYLPYHEPYVSKKQKHNVHHLRHLTASDKSTVDFYSDPHSLFGHPNWLIALVSSLFYEELMLIHDLRDGRYPKERFAMSFAGIGAMAAMIYFAGWVPFLVLAISMRISVAVSWFVFSHVLHRPFVYREGFRSTLSAPTRWLGSFFLGRYGMNAVSFHLLHHRFASIPAEKLPTASVDLGWS